MPSWILAVSRNNLIKISLERSVSISFSVYSLYYFTWLRNILYSSRWMFNNLIKLTKIFWKKIQCNRFYFISLEARAVLRLLVSIKILRQYKKLPWDKFVRKKRTFRKIFCSMQNFLELQCSADDLVDFLELLMFINL